MNAEAARSLTEELEETLTVHRLGVAEALGSSPGTTPRRAAGPPGVPLDQQRPEAPFRAAVLLHVEPKLRRVRRGSGSAGPRGLHESGGKRRYGGLRTEANRYLKWAFLEAANACCRLR